MASIQQQHNPLYSNFILSIGYFHYNVTTN